MMFSHNSSTEITVQALHSRKACFPDLNHSKRLLPCCFQLNTDYLPCLEYIIIMRTCRRGRVNMDAFKKVVRSQQLSTLVFTLAANAHKAKLKKQDCALRVMHFRL